MKKIIVLVSLVLITACSSYEYAKTVNSHSYELYGQEPILVNSEYVEERAQPFNEVLTAYVGYTVADKKVYRKSVYAAEEVKANKSAVMSGQGAGIRFEKNEKRAILGMAYINGENYMMLPADLPDYVVLINQEGKVYKYLGQLKGGRLFLIESPYITSPSSFRFEVITTSKSKQTRPEDGFDIKYSGLRADDMVFTFLDYSKLDGERGYFENVTFPRSQEIVRIEGVGIKVLKATKDKIDYVILK